VNSNYFQHRHTHAYVAVVTLGRGPAYSGPIRHGSKLVNNVKHLSYENQLKKLKLPTLKYRQLRGDMIEVYKIIHGKYDKTCSLELELYQSVHATRTNSLKLTNTKCHYDLRKHFLAAELSIYGTVCHLKLLMRHLLIHSKTDLIDCG